MHAGDCKQTIDAMSTVPVFVQKRPPRRGGRRPAQPMPCSRRCSSRAWKPVERGSVRVPRPPRPTFYQDWDANTRQSWRSSVRRPAAHRTTDNLSDLIEGTVHPQRPVPKALGHPRRPRRPERASRASTIRSSATSTLRTSAWISHPTAACRCWCSLRHRAPPLAKAYSSSRTWRDRRRAGRPLNPPRREPHRSLTSPSPPAAAEPRCRLAPSHAPETRGDSRMTLERELAGAGLRERPNRPWDCRPLSLLGFALDRRVADLVVTPLVGCLLAACDAFLALAELDAADLAGNCLGQVEELDPPDPLVGSEVLRA